MVVVTVLVLLHLYFQLPLPFCTCVLSLGSINTLTLKVTTIPPCISLSVYLALVQTFLCKTINNEIYTGKLFIKLCGILQ